MRRSQSRSVPAAVTNVAGEVLSSSPSRVALILSPPFAGSITYWDQDNPIFGQGLTLGAGATPVQLSIQTDGEMVMHRWWAIADAAGPRFAMLWETHLAEE